MRPVRLLPALLLAATTAAQPPTPADLKGFEQQLMKAAAAAEPAVVCVVVARSELYPPLPPAEANQPGRLGGFDPKEFLASPDPKRQQLGRRLDLTDPANIPDHGYAGGVVIDPAGLVLTPYHVVEGAAKVYVRFVGGHGSYADIYAADARADLAVLKLLAPPPGLKAVPLADVRTADRPGGPNRTVAPGRLVLAAANPYATDFQNGTLATSLGTVSWIGRRTAETARADSRERRVYDFGTLLRCDVRVNPELSGAAVLSADGELIGLTTAAAAVSGGEGGPGYVLPFDEAARGVVDVLRRGEEMEYGFLGITSMDAAAGGTGAVTIQAVMEGGPAKAAGLQSFDRITAVNGHPVRSFDDLLLHVGSARAGTKVKLRVARLGADREVTLGKFAHALPTLASVKPDPVFGLRVDWASVLAAGSDRGVPPGVAFREAAPGSPAAARFKPLLDQSKEWVVTAVDGAAVTTPAEFYRAARGKPAVKLTVADPSNPRATREINLP